ncbi:MAG: aspartyl/asparaginyl beta-hydroxylase domain-containing protein [Sphingosinicella sp.]|uniref:aspartyl/asparaginyl beta-hydroxylase domain-containing protein n=1 Tax=Sphingosinicella sp. TaxID=1917971 RepID=UPI0040379E93
MDQARADTLTRTGIDALRRGDAAAARAAFEAIAEEGGTPPWLGVARACNLLGDAAGEEAALQRQLDADKRDLPALLAMGELKARLGDERVAGLFFRTALNQASVQPQVPQALHPLLNRAQAFVAEAQQRYEAHLQEKLDEAGLSPAAASPRVGQALNLLLGKTQLYLQQPSMFYFPGLPQRQFYERGEFDWLPAVEGAFPAMREELRAVIADEREFDPYVAATPGRPAPNNQLLNDPSWGAWYLWQNGAPVAGHAERCPATMAALEGAPIPVIKGRSPMALYSLLKPGTHIAPHHGMLNTRLICHVPLIAPEGCALRVGGETREWREGEALIFDDSFEHEAWNRATSTRIVLLFEIWRPEIGEAERAELTTLFETVDLYPSGDGPDA